MTYLSPFIPLNIYGEFPLISSHTPDGMYLAPPPRCLSSDNWQLREGWCQYQRSLSARWVCGVSCCLLFISMAMDAAAGNETIYKKYMYICILMLIYVPIMHETIKVRILWELIYKCQICLLQHMATIYDKCCLFYPHEIHVFVANIMFVLQVHPHQYRLGCFMGVMIDL